MIYAVIDTNVLVAAAKSHKPDSSASRKGMAFSRTTVFANRLNAALVLMPNALQRASNCFLISESRRIEIAVVDIVYIVLIL